MANKPITFVDAESNAVLIFKGGDMGIFAGFETNSKDNTVLLERTEILRLRNELTAWLGE